MNKVRVERLNHTFLREISIILETEVKNEILKQVTITDVETTNDLSFSKVYFRVLDDSKKEEVLKSLEKASPFIRKCLSERVEIRHTPELKFLYDESIEYGEKIENLLNNINKEKNNSND